MQRRRGDNKIKRYGRAARTKAGGGHRPLTHLGCKISRGCQKNLSHRHRDYFNAIFQKLEVNENDKIGNKIHDEQSIKILNKNRVIISDSSFCFKLQDDLEEHGYRPWLSPVFLRILPERFYANANSYVPTYNLCACFVLHYTRHTTPCFTASLRSFHIRIKRISQLGYKCVRYIRQ